ncbi:hypothetical protein PFMG_03240 [Plasmodium falciparum IGH-CR14]|uniref:Uncharacterized protein n=1 Tax=Plasmodium falciparum IGH-CR14 TaxID=580059 RepID=A0A0L1ID59_PLAFA|nr:hypothetical protein PFMG_03240 [Plasmodium falciparum IGH-CR14]
MIYDTPERVRLSADIAEKSMYDDMIVRLPKSTKINDSDNSSDGSEKDLDKYENVLELKELCDEKYRVSEEEFEAWRKEFYKDIFLQMKKNNNSENPTGRELF